MRIAGFSHFGLAIFGPPALNLRPIPATAGVPSSGLRLGYEPSLDGIRGIAALIVMTCHVSLLGTGADLSRPLSGLNFPYLVGALAGLDIFFVLSGFLITAQLLKEHEKTGRINFKNFYIRRALRLLPALAVLLSACCLYVLCNWGTFASKVVGAGVLLTLCFGVNTVGWIRGGVSGMLTHMWTLSIEEKFYFAWPILLAILLRSKIGRRGKLLFILASIAGSALLRIACWGSETNFIDRFAQCSLPARADNFLIGCLLAWAACRGGLPHSRFGRVAMRIAAWGAAAVLAHIIMYCPQRPGLILLTGMLAALLIAGLIVGKPLLLRSALSFQPLVWIGRVSYGLYIWHMPIFCLAPLVLYRLIGRNDRSIQLGCALSFAMTFAVAAASYNWVERPCLQWKSRIANRG